MRKRGGVHKTPPGPRCRRIPSARKVSLHGRQRQTSTHDVRIVVDAVRRGKERPSIKSGKLRTGSGAILRAPTALASLGVGFAPNYDSLILASVLMGAFAAVVQVRVPAPLAEREGRARDVFRARRTSHNVASSL